MKNFELRSNYFYGNEVSDYGKENGYVDYCTFAKAFEAVMNNDIMSKTAEIGYWEQVNGIIDNSDEIEELEDAMYEIEQENEDYDENEKWIELSEKADELRDEESNPPEIFQYFIVDNNGADIIQCWSNDPLFYNEELDMYVWGVTHWGTSWDYVLTDIEIVKETV